MERRCSPVFPWGIKRLPGRIENSTNFLFILSRFRKKEIQPLFSIRSAPLFIGM